MIAVRIRPWTVMSHFTIKIFASIDSIEFYKVKVVRGAAGLAVVEGVEAGVGFLELFGAVIERGGGVLGRGDDDRHLRGEDGAVDALRALGCYSEYF